MIVVTGGSGFIGSNLVRSLVSAGREVIVVDDSPPGPNLAGVAIVDHLGQDEFRRRLEGRPAPLAGVVAVLHQGACSSTTEDDEQFLMANNWAYSRSVLDACIAGSVPLVYASSAAVYGAGHRFAEDAANLSPLNGYARSKARFDRDVEALLAKRPAGSSPVVGLRYFNVFGPGEAHKGPMASLVLQWWEQLRAQGRLRIFGAADGYEAGAQQRDFVHVDDVVSVVQWFLEHPRTSGIFNCGTGRSRSFGELAELVVAAFGRGEIEPVPFPDSLKGRYQPFTRADLARLRSVGCTHGFLSLEAGVERYAAVLRTGAR